jgi:acetyltransferase-like isoleucine patch superfamily enzyme
MKEDQNIELYDQVIKILDLRKNKYHPLVFINGEPEIGENVCIGFFSEINAKGSELKIGDNCDIASFVAINVADSHKRCLEIEEEIDRRSIVLENNVFVGSHAFIGGGVQIGHHSVVGAGTILINGGNIPPYSLIIGNPAVVKPEFFKDKK